VQRAAFDQIGSFQVAVVTNQPANVPDCAAAQKKCLVSQIEPTALARIAGADGKPHLAAIFPSTLGDGGTQDLNVSGIPVGKDYAVVIEALSRTSPPTLVGSSCNFVKEISSGKNTTLIAGAITTDAGVACDPRFEK
jgi:hypothetical protein